MNQIPSRKVRIARWFQIGLMIGLSGITGCGQLGALLSQAGQGAPAAAATTPAATPPPAPALGTQQAVAPGNGAALGQSQMASLGPSAPGPVAGGAEQGSPQAAQAVQIAMAQQGDPYSYGASGPDSFDCSGLVQYSFSSVGVGVPRTSSELAQAGTEVQPGDIRAGDLVCWEGHVGIYIGGGQYVHAPQTGDVVRTADLSSRPPNTIRRVI